MPSAASGQVHMVRKLSNDQFRSRLVEHFDILYKKRRLNGRVGWEVDHQPYRATIIKVSSRTNKAVENNENIIATLLVLPISLINGIYVLRFIHLHG